MKKKIYGKNVSDSFLKIHICVFLGRNKTFLKHLLISIYKIQF